MKNPVNDDPIANLLLAGAKRSEASRLAHDADVLEGAARMQLGNEVQPTDLMAQAPGTVLCVAFGGKADGRATRVPYASMKNLQLTGESQAASGLAMIGLLPYEPALMVQVHGMVLAALVVPKGELQSVLDALHGQWDDAQPRPIDRAVARMIYLSLGVNGELIYDLLQSLTRRAATLHEMPDGAPILFQIGASA